MLVRISEKGSEMRKKTQAQPKLTRVIVDTRDARGDKFVTDKELKTLRDGNKLEQINVYSNRWDWAFKE